MRKKKIIIVAAVLVVLGAVGSVFSGGGSVSSEKDGEKVARKVAREYSLGEDQEISYGGTKTMPALYFMVDVGENCGDHVAEVAQERAANGQSTGGEIDTYEYVVGPTTALYVAGDGRVIGADGTGLYRLR